MFFDQCSVGLNDDTCVDAGAIAGLGGTARYQLLERLAELLADSGDTAAAAEQFEAASEAAMEAGKTKLAMKLADRAAQLAPEDD